MIQEQITNIVRLDSLSLLLSQLLIVATCLFLVAMTYTSLLRSSSAAVRHYVWVVLFAALLVMPLFVTWLPEFRPSWGDPSGLRAPAARKSITDNAIVNQTKVRPRVRIESRDRPARFSESEQNGPVRTDSVLHGTPVAMNEAPALPRKAPHAGGETQDFGRSRRWLPISRSLVVIWWIGVLLGCGAIVKNQLVAARIVRRAVALTDPLVLRMIEEIGEALGVRRPVVAACSSDVTVPLVVGCFRPFVLLPIGFARWSPHRHRIVLTHELAHVQRQDLVCQLVGRLACCVYWCHPMVWFAYKRMKTEREHACDDAVLHSGESAHEYAEQLVDVAAEITRFTSEQVLIQSGVSMLAQANQQPSLLLRLLQ